MSIGAAIYTYCSTLSTGTRTYPLTLPQNATTPAHTYQRVSGDTDLTHDSAQDHPNYTGKRYESDRFQFSSYADTYDGAEAVAIELRDALVGYRGTWGDVEISSVLPVLWLDDYEPDTGLFRFIADYTISWRYELGS